MSNDTFSYKEEQIAVQNFTERLKDLGKNGWELVHLEKVGSSHYKCIFKKREESKIYQDFLKMYNKDMDELSYKSTTIVKELSQINEVIDQIYNKLES